MTASRIQAKLLLTGSGSVDPDALIEVFHEWIQRDRVADVLIDVADYRHVHQGPAVLLIGHTSDFGLDLAEGRAGLIHTSKRRSEDEAEPLRGVLAKLLQVAHLLEAEQGLGPIRFGTSEILVRHLDGLAIVQGDIARKQAGDQLREMGRLLYGGEFEVEAVDSSAAYPAFVLRSSAPSLSTLPSLIERLASG